MSIAVMAYVWENSAATGNELLLMLAIADNARADGVAWPGIPSLAKRGRMSERQAQRLIQRLETMGELVVRRNAGPKGTHLYQVVIVQTLPLFAEPGGDTVSPDKMAPVTPKAKRGDIAVSPEPSETINKSRRGTRLPADWKPTPDLQAWARATRPDLNHPEVLAQFVDHWIATPGSRGTKLDWPATYRKWVRGEKRMNGAARPTGTGEPPTITCSVCHQKARIWTAGKCDPCWRASQGLEARP